MIDPSKCVNVPHIASGPDSWKYNLHPDHVSQGWPWRANQIRRVAAMGCPETILHMPLGKITGSDNYPFDMASRLLADDEPYRKLVNDLASNLRPIVLSGHRINAYLGALHCDSMRNLSRYDQADDYLRRLSTNLRPFFSLGCDTIYFDSSSDIATGDPEYGIFVWMFGRGIRVGIESWPFRPGYAGWPIFIIDQTYRTQVKSTGAMKREHAGPIVRTIDFYSDAEKVDAYKAILGDGDTPGVDLFNLNPNLVEAA